MQFGPLVVFGLGGVFTDLLDDRALRLVPLTDLDAADLVRGVRAAPLLVGYRGAPAVDVAAVEDLLLRVGRLAEDLLEVAELDLNPVIARADGVLAVDAKVRLAPPPPRPDLYELNMAAVYLRRGMLAPATFSLFVRQLPPGRGFLVAAGLEDCLEFLEEFQFSDADLDYLC